MTAVGLIGNRAAVDTYMNTGEGQQTAREIASNVFANPDALAAYELGDDLNLRPAVERALDQMITERNAGDPKWLRDLENS
jgi:hypothetical protein